MVAVARPPSAPPRSYHFPEFVEQKLASGQRLVSARVTKLPVVTILIVIDAGSSKDPKGKEGVAALTAAALVEGTRKLSGAELAESFEQLGTSVESGADWDSAVLKITVLPDKLSEAVRLLGEVLMTPAFDPGEIERLRSERLAEILQLETEPRGLADEKFAEFVYAEDSRYSRPDEGTAKSVASLKRDDVISFYESNYTAASTTIIVTGDFQTESIVGLLERAIGGSTQNTAAERKLVTSARSRERKIHIVHKADAPQSEIRVGHVGLPRLHPDFFPTLVMNAVLGGLFGSRINLNLREEHGYTYGASSYYDWRKAAGPFVISTAVQSDVTAAALGEIFREIERIRAEEVSPEELSLATDYLQGVFPIRYETTSSIASALASLVIYGLPADYYDTYRRNIGRVSTADVLMAAKAHIDPTQLQTVIVGDATMIGEPLKKANIAAVQVYDA
ncbi:MAG TPA: pitrilysin family protein [Gemmatimonadaceae bacterium]|nr:pitrilysin family protein [Gemmatimonadaceae bacterium]